MRLLDCRRSEPCKPTDRNTPEIFMLIRLGSLQTFQSGIVKTGLLQDNENVWIISPMQFHVDTFKTHTGIWVFFHRGVTASPVMRHKSLPNSEHKSVSTNYNKQGRGGTETPACQELLAFPIPEDQIVIDILLIRRGWSSDRLYEIQTCKL